MGFQVFFPAAQLPESVERAWGFGILCTRSYDFGRRPSPEAKLVAHNGQGSLLIAVGRTGRAKLANTWRN